MRSPPAEAGRGCTARKAGSASLACRAGKAHPAMANAGLLEARTFRDETRALPEAERALLGMHVGHELCWSEREDAPHQGHAHAASTLGAEHGDAFDFPASIGSPRPRRGDGQSSLTGQEMFGALVFPICLELRWNALLVDEHGASYG